MSASRSGENPRHVDEGGARVLGGVQQAVRSRDGCGDAWLVEHPGNGGLRRGRVDAGADPADLFGDVASVSALSSLSSRRKNALFSQSVPAQRAPTWSQGTSVSSPEATGS